MQKVDFHTHSEASYDGGISEEDYRRMLQSGRLDVIAITDHNTIDTAMKLQQELGEKIIVGEEISTADGDIIGLFLSNAVPPGLSGKATAERIHQQKGLVYVPHPFDHWRKSAGLKLLDQLNGIADVVEVFNGRLISSKYNDLAAAWVSRHNVAGAASSDAHGNSGWGLTYTILPSTPTNMNAAELLLQATYIAHSPTLRSMLYPKLNRIKKRFGHG